MTVPSGLRRGPPGKQVEMGIDRCLLDEAPEEQRGGDGAGEGNIRDVADIGDARGEQLLIGRPEGQSPDRIVDAHAGLGDLGREGVVRREQGGQVGAEREN